MSIKVTEDVSLTLSDLADKFPQDYRGALMDLGSRWRKRMGSDLRSGKTATGNLAALDPITLALKAAGRAELLAARRSFRMTGGSSKSRIGKAFTNKLKWNKGYGGRLPELEEYQIGQDVLKVGFLGNIFEGSPKSAMRFQKAMGGERLTRGQHAMLRITLGDKFRQPTTFTPKPARDDVAPYAEGFSKEAQDYIIHNIAGRLERKLKRVTG
jgi:hypothetical protein